MELPYAVRSQGKIEGLDGREIRKQRLHLRHASTEVDAILATNIIAANVSS